VKLVHVVSAKYWARTASRSRRGPGHGELGRTCWDEAEERSLRLVTEKSPNCRRSGGGNRAGGGLAAVKYADLLPNRQSDYVFNWDKMLAFTGTPRRILLYAYSRSKAFFGSWGRRNSRLRIPKSQPAAPEELALAKAPAHFGLAWSGGGGVPANLLCNYLSSWRGNLRRSTSTARAEAEDRR